MPDLIIESEMYAPDELGLGFQARWRPIPNKASNVNQPGCAAFLTATTTAVARTVGFSAKGEGIPRLGFDCDTNTGPSVLSVRHDEEIVRVAPAASGAARRDGGFTWRCRFGIVDSVFIASRFFLGMNNITTAMPNTAPAGFTNCIGIGHPATSDNLWVYIGGSTLTSIDLGPNFDRTAGIASIYDVSFASPPRDAGEACAVHWQVSRYELAGRTHFMSGTVWGVTDGVELPAEANALNDFQCMRANNGNVGFSRINLYAYDLDIY